MSPKEESLLKTFNKLLGSSFQSLDLERASIPEWDSMKHAELIIQLQKEFKIKFKINDVLEISNLKDFLSLI
jgi:acyl carrier protein